MYQTNEPFSEEYLSLHGLLRPVRPAYPVYSVSVAVILRCSRLRLERLERHQIRPLHVGKTFLFPWAHITVESTSNL